MKTQEEIVKRIEERKPGDVFGFEVDEYFIYLDYEHAKPYLVEEAVAKEWDEATPDLTRESIVSRMKDYMPFAVEKANNRRGLSAQRSIMHYLAWIWLAGDDDLLKSILEDYHDRYSSYGKSILEKIRKFYGWE